MAVKKAKSNIDRPNMSSNLGDKASIGASSVGSASQPNPTTQPMRWATFLGAVAGDCGCERCCGYRDTASMIMNPGQDY